MRCIVFEKSCSGFSNVYLVQDEIKKPRSGFSNVSVYKSRSGFSNTYLVQDQIDKPRSGFSNLQAVQDELEKSCSSTT